MVTQLHSPIPRLARAASGQPIASAPRVPATSAPLWVRILNCDTPLFEVQIFIQKRKPFGLSKRGRARNSVLLAKFSRRGRSLINDYVKLMAQNTRKPSENARRATEDGAKITWILPLDAQGQHTHKSTVRYCTHTPATLAVCVHSSKLPTDEHASHLRLNCGTRECSGSG